MTIPASLGDGSGKGMKDNLTCSGSGISIFEVGLSD